MKVFFSWSGKRSKETADILCTWIRQVIQSADTFISSEIEKGTRWNEKVNKELEDTRVGIICLNKENLTSEWILFEAGALSKTSDAHVCTFLLDISPTDVKPPLGQFQHTLFLKEDIKRLMHTINNKIIAQNEKKLLEKDLDEIFEERWYKLEEKLNEIKNQEQKIQEPTRTDRELLEEILQTVRSQNKTILTKNDYIAYLADNLDNCKFCYDQSYCNKQNKNKKMFISYIDKDINTKIENDDLKNAFFLFMKALYEKNIGDKQDENEVLGEN